MEIEYKFLAENVSAIPLIAKWYFDQWGHHLADSSFEKTCVKLQEYLNDDKLPLCLLAIRNNEVIGAAQLKFREMEIYPEKEHWLGGIYVKESERGVKTAAKLIEEIIKKAKLLEIKDLYLQTEKSDGGLYRKLGWEIIDKTIYKGVAVTVMLRKLDV